MPLRLTEDERLHLGVPATGLVTESGMPASSRALRLIFAMFLHSLILCLASSLPSQPIGPLASASPPRMCNKNSLCIVGEERTLV